MSFTRPAVRWLAAASTARLAAVGERGRPAWEPTWQQLLLRVLLSSVPSKVWGRGEGGGGQSRHSGYGGHLLRDLRAFIYLLVGVWFSRLGVGGVGRGNEAPHITWAAWDLPCVGSRDQLGDRPFLEAVAPCTQPVPLGA